MSNVSKSSPVEGRQVARRGESPVRDLELLMQRLADSREAIVRLLAAVTRGEDAPVEPLRGPKPARVLRTQFAPSPREGLQRGAAPDRPRSKPGTSATRDARRRVLATVLVAVGAVVLLTALVSLW